MTSSEKDEVTQIEASTSNVTSTATEEDITLDESHRVSESESDSSVTAKAKESAKALKELVLTLANRTKEVAVVKTQEFKEAANDERPEFKKDATDIQRLGSLVDKNAESFEKALDIIRAAPYEEQVHLFQGFKKLLNEEINVVNARLSMASRLTFTNEQASRTTSESA